MSLPSTTPIVQIPSNPNKPPAHGFIGIVRRAFEIFQRSDSPRMAAALSYFTTFALAPLIILVTVVAGLIFDQTTVRQQILSSVATDVGVGTADLLAGVIDQMSKPQDSIVSTIISVIALMLGAIGVFSNMQGAFDRIWDVKPEQMGQGIRGFLTNNLISLGMVVGVGFLLLLSLVVSTVLSALTAGFNSIVPGADWLLGLGNFAVSFVVITLLFAMMFRVLPHATVVWRDVWGGAALTSLLFTVGKTLLGLYLARSTMASVYGAAGSLVAVLIWIFYAAQILLLGASYTRAAAETRKDRRGEPKKKPIKVKRHKKASVPEDVAVPDNVSA
ncbi:MAG: YihY/virulence factor BrkB family protein [Chloroflexota bacterium]|nr:YihY/virulence factor BrkB family protein [Chloroflexota bacterium]